ncbi:MAG: protein kinase [Polyangiaceae bacterium]|nr:protein kinase [Polyangiaceae bacterium]
MSEIRCPQCATSCDPVHRFCHICGFPISEAVSRADDPLIGTTLPGGYVILDLLGVGGMGRVYRAEQKALGRTVAVKIIHPYLLGDESASVRFITEARAASRLNHPNIVSVFDFGKSDNQLYLVMEYLRGRDLARVDYEDGPLPFKRIVDVMMQVLAGLGEAHELGIIHRDLKPENIVLEPMRKAGDFVKVVDFGLAKMRELPSSHITSPGIVCGTPDYMSPEQGRGDPIDGRSDLYTCGVLLFQLLTGRLPFEAESPTQVVLMHLTLPPPNPSVIAPTRRIPQALVNITLKALEKDVNKRYQTADQFAADLRTVFAENEAAPISMPLGDAGIQCRSCSTMVPRGQKFCGECGERVLAPAPASQPRSAKKPAGSGRTRAPSPAPSQVPEFPLRFVGRERDLDWLGARRFGMENSLVAASIVAEPGTGATRLLEEFLQRNAESGDVVVKMTPDPWGADVGYHALRTAITRLAGLPEGGGEVSDWRGATPEARAGLMAVFGKNDLPPPPSSTKVWSKPTLGAVLPDDRRFTAAEALRWAIMRANERHRGRLVILAIDDFHAVDGASRNAIADVVAEPPMHSLLLIATHAPEFDAAWIGPTLKLKGIPATLLMHIAAPVLSYRTDITEETLLSPLYVDQALRFSVEGGTNPPLQLADLIAQRIERLPLEARRVLQAVSVLGDDAGLDDIGRILQDSQEVSALLTKLKDAGLVKQDLGSFRAAHPMIREITLATTPVAVRRDLHARALVDREGDPLPFPIEVRALHAQHAQDSLEALMLLEQVADRANERGDREGAVLALRRGLELARREMFRGELDEPEKAVLIFSRKLGEVLATSGALTDADGVLREALDLAGPAGVERAWLLGVLAHVAHKRDRAKDAVMFYAQALENARAHGASDLVASLEKMRRDWAAV